jgi:hypothetical protein
MNAMSVTAEQRPHPAIIAVCVLSMIALIGMVLQCSAAQTVNVIPRS